MVKGYGGDTAMVEIQLLQKRDASRLIHQEKRDASRLYRNFGSHALIFLRSLSAAH